MRFLLPAFLMSSTAVLADVPRVATDIAPVHSLVSMVLGDLGEAELILPPGASPHHYAMKPSEARALSQAELVVWVGEGLTPWLEGPIETLGSGAHVLLLSEVPGLSVLENREMAMFGAEVHDDHDEHGHDDHDAHGHDDHDAHKHDDHGHKDEEHHHDHEVHAEKHDDHAHDDHAEKHDDHGHNDHAGHDHGAFDPHLWLEPSNASLWLTVIAEELAELDPENAETYAMNARKAQSHLQTTRKAVEERLKPVQEKPFLVLHDAFQYFEAFAGLSALAAVQSSDDETAGPARIAELKAFLAENEIFCAFTEPGANTRLLNTVVEGMDVQVGELDPLGSDLPLGADLYPGLLTGLAAALEDCLK